MGIVRPHLWYHSQALEAAEFYVSLVPNSQITSVTHAPPGIPDVAEGTPFIVDFTLDGMPVQAISAGPSLTLDEAFSFIIDVETQDEIDHYWDALTADGGEPGQCGWCTDRFGLSWQVVPRVLEEYLSGSDERSQRATQEMLTQTKLDIARLRAAYDGTS